MFYRRHSPKRVVTEIKILQQEYGIREILFLDDEFFINEEWIRQFCQMVCDEGIDIVWTAYGRADRITEDMLKSAKKAGCWGILMGVESGNQDILDKIQKGITLEQVRRVCKWAKETGLLVRASFMLGLPGETPEKARKTINFAIELDLATAVFNLAFPEYGTKLYDIAIKEGKLVNEWVSRTSCAYIPNGYKNAREVEKMQRLAFRKFYFRPGYILKRVKRIRSFNDLKRDLEGLKFLLGLVF